MKFLSIKLSLIFSLMSFVPFLVQSQTFYPNLDINGTLYDNQYFFDGVTGIQTMFNDARTFENGRSLGIGQVTMPALNMPSQSVWDIMSDNEKGLWIINSERVARGLLPFEDTDPNVISIAQDHADYIFDNNIVICHECTGAPYPHNVDPWTRLDSNPAINGHHDFLAVAENIGWRGNGFANDHAIEQFVYNSIYVDANSNWGHRRALLFEVDPLNNNYGVAGSECLIGFGRAVGTYQEVPLANVMVYNVIDPDQTYNPSLPVELSSFTATASSSKILLNWQTATEVNNYGFEILRQAQDDEWVTLGFVDGHGNSNSPKVYQFTDSNPTGGSKYNYRLKQIDNDGTFEYSDIVEVEYVPTEFALYQNYPNPFNPATKIKYSLPQESNVTIKIFDILGNQVRTLVKSKQQAGTYEVEFEGTNLVSGIYIYKMQTESFNSTKKMLLMK